MRRSVARLARRLAVALTVPAAVAACSDDGPPVTAPVIVVDVAATGCDRPLPSRGVGVAVADGLVATAAHVVDGPRRDVTVDGRAADVVLVDARTDLALLAAPVHGTAVLGPQPTGGRDVVVRTPVAALPVTIVRTGTLIVHDTSAGVRHEREAHTIRPGVTEGTSGAPLVDGRGAVVGIVILDNQGDGTAYAVTSAELAALLTENRRPAADVRCRE